MFTTEIHVHIHSIIDAARGQYVFTEFRGNLRVEDITRLLISLESVAIQHFRPDIAIITGGISTFHRMSEISGAVARRNLTDQTTIAQDLRLKFLDIQIGRDLFQYMIIHIQIRGGQILRRSEALSILATLNHLVYKGLRYYLAGLVMFSVHFQYLRLNGPMLIDLRR